MYFTKIDWAPSETLFKIGSFGIHYYSLMFIIAFGLGYYMMKKIYDEIQDLLHPKGDFFKKGHIFEHLTFNHAPCNTALHQRTASIWLKHTNFTIFRRYKILHNNSVNKSCHCYTTTFLIHISQCIMSVTIGQDTRLTYKVTFPSST